MIGDRLKTNGMAIERKMNLMYHREEIRFVKDCDEEDKVPSTRSAKFSQRVRALPQLAAPDSMASRDRNATKNRYIGCKCYMDKEFASALHHTSKASGFLTLSPDRGRCAAHSRAAAPPTATRLPCSGPRGFIQVFFSVRSLTRNQVPSKRNT